MSNYYAEKEYNSWYESLERSRYDHCIGICEICEDSILTDGAGIVYDGFYHDTQSDAKIHKECIKEYAERKLSNNGRLRELF